MKRAFIFPVILITVIIWVIISGACVVTQGDRLIDEKKNQPAPTIAASPTIPAAPFISATPTILAIPTIPAMGVNLEWVSDYASQLIFVDGFKRSRSWVSNNYPRDDSWDSGVEIPIGDNGYPLEIPYTPPKGGPPQVVTTMMYTEMGGHYPSGTYTLMFEGTGLLVLDSHAIGYREYTMGGIYPVEVDASKGVIFLEIYESRPEDRIRNIRFIMPGYETVYETKPFYPPFLERLRGFQVVRFAQTMQTNGGDYPCDNGVPAISGDCVKLWATRNTPGSQTQATMKGVSLEYLIDLANTTGFDPWFNIQHGADDDYIRQFAQLVLDRLDPALRAYVELSNEIFNFSEPYPQYHWATEMGLALELDTNPTLSRIKFTAMRSAEMFAIFEEVFGEQQYRLVKIVPGHLGDTWMNEQLLNSMLDPILNPSGIQGDALAIGAYFGVSVAEEIVWNGEIESITVDEILDRAEANITIDRPDPFEEGGVTNSVQTMVQSNKVLAEAYGLDLIAYEGGQHIIEFRGWDNDPVLGAKIIEANRHPRMYDLYRQLLEVWYGNGGGLFIHYSFIRRPSQFWGSFGSLEWTEQPIEEAHKYRALRDYLGNTISVPDGQ